MNRKILLAVDNTRPSKLALEYAVQLSTMIPDLHFSLLHIQPMISLFLIEEARTSALARKKMEKISNTNARFGQSYWMNTESTWCQGYCPRSHRPETQARKLGFSKDIIEFAQQGPYDAIVVGRRGLSGLARLYAGSVTGDILEQSQVIPVWLVDGEAGAGEILVAVDGSEASLRVVDHISFMMSGDSTMRATLVHVASNARNSCAIDMEEHPDAELDDIIVRGDKACIDQFYSRVLEKFKQAGIEPERVRFETIQGRGRVGRAIMDYAEKGDYRTLVVGRRGIDRSFFMGSVSRYMINNLSNGALWLIP